MKDSQALSINRALLKVEEKILDLLWLFQVTICGLKYILENEIITEMVQKELLTVKTFVLIDIILMPISWKVERNN